MHEINIYTYEHFNNIIGLGNSLLLPPLLALFPLHESKTLFYLEIPLLVIVVRMSIHSRPRLVINCSPLAA